MRFSFQGLITEGMKPFKQEERDLKQRTKTTIYNEDGIMSGAWPHSMKPLTPGMDEMLRSGFTQSAAYQIQSSHDEQLHHPRQNQDYPHSRLPQLKDKRHNSIEHDSESNNSKTLMKSDFPQFHEKDYTRLNDAKYKLE